MHRTRYKFPFLALFILGSCVPLQRTSPRSHAEAWIARDSAVFVFPPESLDTLTWNPRTPGTHPVGVDWTWIVQWAPAPSGADSVSMIAVNRPHRADQPIRRGSLAELLGETSAEQGIPCWRCREPAVRFTPVSGVTAHARNHQAVIVVRGSALVQHFFWSHPDTVYLENTGSLSDGLLLRVKYR